jgi:AraC family transcriptional regulator
MIKWIVSSILLGIFGLAAYLVFHLGYFAEVTTGETDLPDRKIIFIPHFGSYHSIVPKIQEIESWALANSVDCRMSFGEYFDNPEQVEQERLKSRGGCIVEKIPAKKPERFETGTLKGGHFFTATYKGSPAIGPFKVYPLVLGLIANSKYKMQGWNVVEVYEVHPDQSVTTNYFFPTTVRE